MSNTNINYFFAGWSCERTIKYYTEDGYVLARGETEIARVKNFCQAEMAWQIEQDVILPAAPIFTHFLSAMDSAMTTGLGPEAQASVRAFMKAVESPILTRALDIANAMPDADKAAAIQAAVNFSKFKTGARKLTSGELVDQIRQPGTPAFMANPDPAAPPKVIALQAYDKEVGFWRGVDIWRQLLKARDLYTDENHDQACAWALHFGFEVFKTLPLAEKIVVVGGTKVHPRAIKT